MITIAQLKAWGLAASLVATSQRAHLSDAVLDGMARAAVERPIGTGDDGVRTMMGFAVAIAFFETGAQMTNDPHGPNDGGRSHCWGQVYLPGDARTFDGWSGADLRADPYKCAMAVAHIVGVSVAKGPVDCPLCLYSRGRVSPDARALDSRRTGLARSLMASVSFPPPNAP